jgi:hypothetical protein
MRLDPSAVATLIVFIAAQTGALIFYAGVMLTMMRDHDKRLDKGEDRTDRLSAAVYTLNGRAGIQNERI